MKNLFAILITSLISTSAFATDALNFKSLGFSPDGRYYAFVQSAIGDGSGAPYASAYVVDVERNTQLRSETVFIDSESAKESQAIEQVIAKLKLSDFAIDGKHLGRSLWLRLPTDLTPAAKDLWFAQEYMVDGGASTLAQKYQLQLTEVSAPKGECYDDNIGKMISLSLTKWEYNKQVSQVVLQQDNHVPKSRGCAWSYQVRQVIEYKGAIVAVLRHESYGFEGPDYRHMVVTGAKAL